MRTEIYNCDFCNNEMRDIHFAGFQIWREGVNATLRKYELCLKCYNSLSQFISERIKSK